MHFYVSVVGNSSTLKYRVSVKKIMIINMIQQRCSNISGNISSKLKVTLKIYFFKQNTRKKVLKQYETLILLIGFRTYLLKRKVSATLETCVAPKKFLLWKMWEFLFYWLFSSSIHLNKKEKILMNSIF